jgi:hypothetical protein
VLINTGAKGELIFFRPDYAADPLYASRYFASSNSRSSQNNVVGRPSLRETIDGVYSEVQCWSTAVGTGENLNTDNPNDQYRHSTYRPTTNPLPFERRHVFSDGEAINEQLRMNRAIWKYQLGQFESWQYEVEFPTHSQNGAFFVSDTMISCEDTVNGVAAGAYYVQSVRRSLTLGGGMRTKLTIRKPGLLNPELDSLNIGAGAKPAAKTKKAVP